MNVLINNSRTRNGKYILKSHRMNHLINFPTRVDKTTGTETARDNILTNLSHDAINVIGVITELSDHDGQLFKVLYNPIDNPNATSKSVKVLRKTFSANNIEYFAVYWLKKDGVMYFCPCRR